MTQDDWKDLITQQISKDDFDGVLGKIFRAIASTPGVDKLNPEVLIADFGDSLTDFRMLSRRKQ